MVGRLTSIDADLNQRLDYELMMLEHNRKEYAARLDSLCDYKGSFLRRAKAGGKKYYYYIKRPGTVSYHYLGNSAHREVARVREARFLEEALKRIDRDIDLVKALKDGFVPYDPSYINESLPALYRCEVPPASELYRHESAKWLADRLAYQKQMPENYPQHKRHRTSDGVMVKTISEVVLYERFKDAGLALIYELPLVPGDYGPPMYPDITVLSPIDMRTEIIVEYVGRLDLREYREDFAKKVARYIANGYKPGVNLFFVFSDKNGNIDSMQITKVIADILGLRDAQLS